MANCCKHLNNEKLRSSNEFSKVSFPIKLQEDSIKRNGVSMINNFSNHSLGLKQDPYRVLEQAEKDLEAAKWEKWREFKETDWKNKINFKDKILVISEEYQEEIKNFDGKYQIKHIAGLVAFNLVNENIEPKMVEKFKKILGTQEVQEALEKVDTTTQAYWKRKGDTHGIAFGNLLEIKHEIEKELIPIIEKIKQNDSEKTVHHHLLT